MVASTGGPPALATVLQGLPAKAPFSVVIAQHIGMGFTDGLVRWLQGVTQLRVLTLSEPRVAGAGEVYLPIDGYDIEVEPGGRVKPVKSNGGVCPSGDRLLRSVAKAAGKRAVGAVLTGMGDDGAAGLMAIRAVGGVTIAQDEATSVVFGMPHAAAQNGAAQEVLPVEAIAPFVCGLVQADRK
jgi:two-component system chemotaxis response regulator CheB